MIPAEMRVIFTYPRPIDNSSAWYGDRYCPAALYLGAGTDTSRSCCWHSSYCCRENEMRKACGSLKNVEFIPMDSFANPFAGWVDTRPMVKTKYTLFMHNDVYPMNPEVCAPRSLRLASPVCNQPQSVRV